MVLDLQGADLVRIMASSLVENFQKLGLKPARPMDLELSKYKTNIYSHCRYQETLLFALDKIM